MKTINKINFGTSVNLKNVNLVEDFTCLDDARDEIMINTPHSAIHYTNKYPDRGHTINIMDIEYDIDKFSVEQKYYTDIRVCGKFTYKFAALDADLRDILDTETIHTGYIYYFESHYEDIKELEDYSYLYFNVKLDIVEKNDVYTRTVKIHAETKLVDIDFD